MVDEGNPLPELIRRWRIPSPYDLEACFLCPKPVLKGQLINIEFEAGVSHSECSDEEYGFADQ